MPDTKPIARTHLPTPRTSNAGPDCAWRMFDTRRIPSHPTENGMPNSRTQVMFRTHFSSARHLPDIFCKRIAKIAKRKSSRTAANTLNRRDTIKHKSQRGRTHYRHSSGGRTATMPHEKGIVRKELHDRIGFIQNFYFEQNTRKTCFFRPEFLIFGKSYQYQSRHKKFFRIPYRRKRPFCIRSSATTTIHLSLK